MTMSATDLESMLDSDTTPTCEAKWLNPVTGAVYLCDATATWAAMAHDEAEDHDYVHISLCGRCVMLVKGKFCDDDKLPLLKNAHRI